VEGGREGGAGAGGGAGGEGREEEEEEEEEFKLTMNEVNGGRGGGVRGGASEFRNVGRKGVCVN
jgi:hypothetical protein